MHANNAKVITMKIKKEHFNPTMNDDLIWLNITSSWQERVVLLSKWKFDQIIRNQLRPPGSFLTKQPFWLVVAVLPSWAQLINLHWGWLSLFSSISIYFTRRQVWTSFRPVNRPTSCPCRPTTLIGECRMLSNSERRLPFNLTCLGQRVSSH